MSTGRKISVRKVIQTLVTLVAVTGCSMAMLSADRLHRQRTVRDVQLRIQSTGGVQFLTDSEVRDAIFHTRHINPKKISVEKLDERSMEAILQSNPWVRTAQVYTDANRVMHVNVTQRVPVVRLFEEDGNSYYLDDALQTMPLSMSYTHYAPVVTGVPHLRNDSVSNIIKGNIVGLVRSVGAHPFWKAQISQINKRPDGGFELVPVLGRQRIIIGDTARLDEKLENLLAFYKQVQNKVGWDQYRSIDLRYAGQVVASPALKWKAPVDRAISNINWLKAIMETAPSQDKPGGDAAGHDSGDNANVAKPTAANIPAATKPEPKPAAHSETRTALVPKSPLPAKPKLNPKDAKKLTGPATNKTTTKNTKSHAATIR